MLHYKKLFRTIVKVNDDWYYCSQYDVNGNSIWGSSDKVNLIRTQIHTKIINKIYYNPSDPSEAVLIPGISFSLKARFFFKVFLFGMVISLPGVYRIRKKYKQLVYDADYDYDGVVSVPTLPVKQPKSYSKFTRNAIVCIAVGLGTYLCITIINHYRINNTWAIVQQENGGEDLREALEFLNTRRQSLANLTLRKANLEGVQLEGAILNYSDLQSAILINANLEKAMMHKVDFQHANLRGANLSEAKLYYANLSNANLEGANLKNSILKDATLNFANLQGADFFEANLFSIEMTQADLSSANLSECELYHAILNGAILQDAKLIGAKLRKAELKNTNFIGADLQGANLEEANFLNANLQEANLKGAKLHNANLRNANLNKANLEEVNFSKVKLDGANLKEALLKNAQFPPTDSLTMLSKEQRASIIITRYQIEFPRKKSHSPPSGIYDITTTHDENGNPLPEENWKLISKP